MEEQEWFDVVDENGQPTGETVSRQEAHEKGIPHRSAHVWILRKRNGKMEVLLQKRSDNKDSFPGMYDTSSAGHIPAGEEPLESAVRELSEELGIIASADQLAHAGHFHIRYEKVFHGKLFRDNEYASVYVYDNPVEISDLSLQESEVSEVQWFDMEEVWQEIQNDRHRFCVPKEGLAVLKEYLKETEA